MTSPKGVLFISYFTHIWIIIKINKYQRPLKILYRMAEDTKLEVQLGQNLGIIFFGKWIYAMQKCRRPKDLPSAKKAEKKNLPKGLEE